MKKAEQIEKTNNSSWIHKRGGRRVTHGWGQTDTYRESQLPGTQAPRPTVRGASAGRDAVVCNWWSAGGTSGQQSSGSSHVGGSRNVGRLPSRSSVTFLQYLRKILSGLWQGRGQATVFKYLGTLCSQPSRLSGETVSELNLRAC